MAQLLAKSASRAMLNRQSRSVRVKASVPENVVDARKWISSYKARTEARANRPSWFPGTKLPDHLDGTLPGDFGFDPLGLGKDPANLAWNVQAELVHSRFAMLAAAGIIFPEAAANAGISWPGAGVSWVQANTYTYWASPFTLFFVQMLLFAFVELKRWQDIKVPGSANQDPIFSGNKLPAGNTPGYPGGIFDPFGWSKGDLQSLKVKEIKNGRLAMMAVLGFAGQAYTTGKTPLQNLNDHLADPFATTVISNDIGRLLNH